MKHEDEARQQPTGQVSEESDPGDEAPSGSEMQGVLDALPFYVMLVDAGHHILLANKAVKQTWGWIRSRSLAGIVPRLCMD